MKPSDFTKREKRADDPAWLDKVPGGRRKSGGNMVRFLGTSHHANEKLATLKPDHAAIVNATTVYPKSVFDPVTTTKPLLVSGKNNAKIGGMVTNGPWNGCAIYHLTLTERETCPPTCATWASCYGNAMPFSRRHRPGANASGMMRKIEKEIEDLLARHGRVAIRLHVLGDFFSLPYVAFWVRMIRDNLGLHVWGYTAHARTSPIGEWLDLLNRDFPDRWVVRFSNAPHNDVATGIIWRQPEGVTVPEGMVCPASMQRTAACGTCGLCWSKEMQDKRIVFIGHGMNKRGGK